jgi:hypothetical protein
MRTLALLFPTALIACDSDPSDSADAGPDTPDDTAATNTGDTAAPDTTTTPDDAPDSTTCEGGAGFDCVQDCATDVSFSAECFDGSWRCPDNYPNNFDTCESNCEGDPDPCCDSAGENLGNEECFIGQHSCLEGRTDWCCDLQGFDGGVETRADDWFQQPACIEGEIVCPENTIPWDEC